MADEPNKPKDPASDASGAGTTKAHKLSKAEQAKLPGGEDFDVINASAEDFAKHEEILRRLSLVASLKPAPVTVVDAPAVAAAPTPDPTDIRAVNASGEVRYFTALTWEALGEQRGGWQEQVGKPTDI